MTTTVHLWRRASIYVRLSKAATEANMSRDDMVKKCQDLAASHGLAIVAVHVDDGISGAVRNRPEFQAWLSDGRTGMADVLVTFHVDRLTREGVNVGGMILDVVEGKDSITGKESGTGVRLLDVKDGIDSEDGESFRWKFVISAEVGRSERKAMQRRSKDNAARLKEAGRFHGGTVPFGARVVERDGGKYLEVNPEEARLIREVATRLISGEAMRYLVAYMNEHSKPRRGTEWEASTVRLVLKSEAVRSLVLDYSTAKALDEKWASRKTGGGRPTAALLSGGRAVCDGCGSPMRKNADSYRCARLQQGLECPTSVSVKVGRLDEWLAKEFLARFGDLPSMRARMTVRHHADIEALEKALKEAQGALLADLTPENMAKAQEAKDALKAAQDEAPEVGWEYVSDGYETIADRWEDGDISQRGRMLASVMAEPVRVLPGKQDRWAPVEQRIRGAWLPDALAASMLYQVQ